jgi:hypothetical protein
LLDDTRTVDIERWRLKAEYRKEWTVVVREPKARKGL